MGFDSHTGNMASSPSPSRIIVMIPMFPQLFGAVEAKVRGIKMRAQAALRSNIPMTSSSNTSLLRAPMRSLASSGSAGLAKPVLVALHP